MNKELKLVHFLLVYPSLWILYCIFEIISGNINTLNSIIMNLIPALLLVIVSALLFSFYKKSIVLSGKITTFIIFLLFLIDQLSKIFISIVFKRNNLTSINIIPNYFSITPDLNDKGSFIASRFDLNAPFIIFIFLNFLILVLIFFIYKYIIYKNDVNPINQITFIFLFSGGLCSLIDKIFWGGSLDFLHIHNLFIADIKDIFITFGLGSFILSNIISSDQIQFKNVFEFVIKSIKNKL